MPSSTEQDAKPGTPLTNDEIGRIMQVIEDYTFAETKVLCNALILNDGAEPPVILPDDDQALIKQMRADLDLFFNVFPDGTIRAGEDYDNTRDKDSVRRIIRRRLGLSPVSSTEIQASRTVVRSSNSVEAGVNH